MIHDNNRTETSDTHFSLRESVEIPLRLMPALDSEVQGSENWFLLSIKKVQKGKLRLFKV